MLRRVVAMLLSVGAAAATDEWSESYQEFSFVFVGGYHFSGTTVLAQLLVTQPWALGLTSVPLTLPNCVKPSCRAPEGEGCFLTTAFLPLNRESECKPDPWWDTGMCGRAYLKVAARAAADRARLSRMRAAIWRDWRRFFIGCRPATRFLIEKDIPNLYRAPLLAAMFGARRVSFVYSLRHPLASHVTQSDHPVKYDVWRARVEHWLDAHDVMTESTETLERVMTFQHERLRMDPLPILNELTRLIGLPNSTIDYIDGRRLNLHKGSLDNGQVHLKKLSAFKPVVWDKKRRHLDALHAQLAAYCYSIDSLEPLTTEEDHCASPIFTYRRTRPPLVPRPSNSSCAWPVATELARRKKKKKANETTELFLRQHKKKKQPPAPPIGDEGVTIEKLAPSPVDGGERR